MSSRLEWFQQQCHEIKQQLHDLLPAVLTGLIWHYYHELRLALDKRWDNECDLIEHWVRECDQSPPLHSRDVPSGANFFLCDDCDILQTPLASFMRLPFVPNKPIPYLTLALFYNTVVTRGLIGVVLVTEYSASPRASNDLSPEILAKVKLLCATYRELIFVQVWDDKSIAAEILNAMQKVDELGRSPRSGCANNQLQ